ncbi:uncharacterized protein [Leptinotarsa decemlineata]|uniref:uncharacterized protein n=1 Tax=Leptinotarsa decemlineata TaxID=7539 RepID=UPI003D3092A7
MRGVFGEKSRMARRCSRKISSTQLEHNDPEVREWFASFIEMLESDAAIDRHRRLSVLREVFSRGALEKILSIVTLESRKAKGFSSSETDYQEKSISSSESSLTLATEFESQTAAKCRYFRQPRISTRMSKVMPSRLSRAFYAKPKRAAERLFDFRRTGVPNPYLSFFKKKEGLQAIWRDIPSLLLEKQSLGDKADVVSERIATEFINWLKKVDLLDDTLQVKSLIEMFEVGSKMYSSLKVFHENLFVVSKNSGHGVHLKEGGNLGSNAQRKKEFLYNEIHKDMKASYRIPKTVAFGKTIPIHEQNRPTDRNYMKRLLRKHIPEELATGELVWKDILDLESTKRFCSYMATNYPEVAPPDYLVDAGLMDLKNNVTDATTVSKVSSWCSRAPYVTRGTIKNNC